MCGTSKPSRPRVSRSPASVVPFQCRDTRGNQPSNSDVGKRRGPVIETARVFDSIDSIADEWDRLVDRVRATPFVRPGWMQAWLAAFGDSGLRIYTVWRDEHLVALLPLRARRHALSSPTNFQTPSFAPLAEDSAAANALTQAVLAADPRRLSLGHLASEVPATAECQHVLRQRGYRQLTQYEMWSPYTDVQLDWEVFKKRFRRDREKSLRRKRRQLSELGTLRLDIQDGRDRLDDLLAEGFAVEASGWKGRQKTAVQLNPDLHRLYKAVARWATEKGWLRLFFLRLDERAIAFELALHHDDVLYDLKGGYDEEYRRWSPGILLMSDMIRTACAADTSVIEWLGADEPFKREWSDGVRMHTSSTWLAPTLFRPVKYHWFAGWWEIRRHSKYLLDERLPESLSTQLKTARAQIRRRTGSAHEHPGRPDPSGA